MLAKAHHGPSGRINIADHKQAIKNIYDAGRILLAGMMSTWELFELNRDFSQSEYIDSFVFFLNQFASQTKSDGSLMPESCASFSSNIEPIQTGPASRWASLGSADELNQQPLPLPPITAERIVQNN